MIDHSKQHVGNEVKGKKRVWHKSLAYFKSKLHSTHRLTSDRVESGEQTTLVSMPGTSVSIWRLPSSRVQLVTSSDDVTAGSGGMTSVN